MIITCACQHLKQEVRCLATKTSDSVPDRKVLPCDDECLRLQRNARLAAALNIPVDHTDVHIPYSAATLSLFRAAPQAGQAHERVFRVFAADDAERRMRFKPMARAQRAFLHALAEDFGLDSESADPEPHRHVVVFKAPRFVKAPMKTLGQCVAGRPALVAGVAEESTSGSASMPANVAVPFNALVLGAPRFALTVEELRGALATAGGDTSTRAGAGWRIATAGGDASTKAVAGWRIEFLPSEEIVLRPAAGGEGADEAALRRLKPAVANVVRAGELAASVSLCAIDGSLNVVRREDEGGAGAGGWSQVVRGAPAGRKAEGRVMAGRNAFTVLGTRGERRKREEKERERERESVVENWEDAVGDGEDAVGEAEDVGEVAGEAEEAGGSGEAAAGGEASTAGEEAAVVGEAAVGDEAVAGGEAAVGDEAAVGGEAATGGSVSAAEVDGA